MTDLEKEILDRALACERVATLIEQAQANLDRARGVIDGLGNRTVGDGHDLSILARYSGELGAASASFRMRVRNHKGRLVECEKSDGS